REPTTFSDGSVVASLRWAGPPIRCDSNKALFARRDEQVVVATDHTLTSLGDALSRWPIAPGRREKHGQPSPFSGPVTQLALLDGGEVLVGSSSPAAWLARWRAGGDEPTPERMERVAAFEATPDGGLYVVRRPVGVDLVIEHRATRAFDEPPRVLGEVKGAGAARTALLDDGSLLIAMHGDARGGPIGLYRARAAGAGSLEVLQPYPGATGGHESKASGARREIVAVGATAFLVASPRGAWFVTGNETPTKPGEWPPIHVYTLVGDDLAPEGPPFVVPQEPYERAFGACAIGDQVAVGTKGRSVGVTITDGRVGHRVEGLLGRGGQFASSLLASPRGDVLLVALQQGVARCDVLRPGGARLAEPPYVEPEPAREVEPPAPPRPSPPPTPSMKRAAWVERVRLVHLVITMSSLHFPSGQGMHAFEGDAAAGRSFSFDGSGNHHVVGWSPEGVVAFGFDHDFSRTKNAELLDELPADVRPLAEELIVWKAPVNDVAWWSVAEDRRGGASNTHRLDDLKNPDVEKACAALQEHHGISDAMLDLARTLARETGGARR
ncbi:MAG TPA: hypothetical protein VGM56_32425, partial [Byssovorax sp.]